MNRIRVAIGEVQSQMSRDILGQIARLEDDLELVGPVSPETLKEDLAAQNADVLICDVRGDELPSVCRMLFEQPAAPVVVGLAREGRELSVCVPNAGADQLISLIRAAARGSATEEKVVELLHPEPPRAGGSAAPYTSIWDCLDDQLNVLDLALLAEVDNFEATT